MYLVEQLGRGDRCRRRLTQHVRHHIGPPAGAALLAESGAIPVCALGQVTSHPVPAPPAPPLRHRPDDQRRRTDSHPAETSPPRPAPITAGTTRTNIPDVRLGAA